MDAAEQGDMQAASILLRPILNVQQLEITDGKGGNLLDALRDLKPEQVAEVRALAAKLKESA